ncbi:MAG: hypothetical protein M3O46_15930, partial [Myxococcota bacterium]|nr:hypothetical protein [Myxococcota bacterium]
AGWGGDRGVLVTNGDRAAFAWRLRYDAGKTQSERAAFVFPMIARGIDRSLGPPAVGEATFDCHERVDRGPLALARVGTDVVLVAGPAKIAPTSLWSSAGGCALARKWVREIGGAP